MASQSSDSQPQAEPEHRAASDAESEGGDSGECKSVEVEVVEDVEVPASGEAREGHEVRHKEAIQASDDGPHRSHCDSESCETKTDSKPSKRRRGEAQGSKNDEGHDSTSTEAKRQPKRRAIGAKAKPTCTPEGVGSVAAVAAVT